MTVQTALHFCKLDKANPEERALYEQLSNRVENLSLLGSSTILKDFVESFKLEASTDHEFGLLVTQEDEVCEKCMELAAAFFSKKAIQEDLVDIIAGQVSRESLSPLEQITLNTMLLTKACILMASECHDEIPQYLKEISSDSIRCKASMLSCENFPDHEDFGFFEKLALDLKSHPSIQTGVYLFLVKQSLDRKLFIDAERYLGKIDSSCQGYEIYKKMQAKCLRKDSGLDN